MVFDIDITLIKMGKTLSMNIKHLMASLPRVKPEKNIVQ